MLRNITLEEISDGKLYGLNDMVRADCNDCKGCSACCRGMGSSILLDPLDIKELKEKCKMTFEELVSHGYIELNVVESMILPNLKMNADTEACSFLDDKGRCSIHESRPGICRIFPLGRYYEEDRFKYFLQVHECANSNRSKIKVKKWIDREQLDKYEKYICDWHFFTKELSKKLMECDEKLSKQVNMYILNAFYIADFNKDKDFYEQYNDKMNKARELIR